MTSEEQPIVDKYQDAISEVLGGVAAARDPDVAVNTAFEETAESLVGYLAALEGLRVIESCADYAFELFTKPGGRDFKGRVDYLKSVAHEANVALQELEQTPSVASALSRLRILDKLRQRLPSA